MEPVALRDGQSRLCSLPPELRNRIYRYALVTDDRINVQRHVNVPSPPGLLQTSRQIRNETHAIYSIENSFHFIVFDFDAFLLQRWCVTFVTATAAVQSARDNTISLG